MAFNISDQMLPTLDQTAAHRQARFGYIPLFGLLLANMLSQSALAKFAPLGAIRLSYEPLPLIKRPVYHHDNYNSWNPPGHTYGPAPSDLDTQHIHHHHHVPPASQNQIVHINDRPPEIIIIDSDTEGTDQNETTAPAIFTEEFPPLPMLRSSLEKPNTDEPIAAESRAVSPQLLAFLSNATTPSSKKVKRGTGKYTKTRQNNKYISQKKRRPTSSTAPDYYYDSYEEGEEDATATTRRYQQKRKNPYQQRKPIIDSYEESESSISNSYSDLGNESQEYEYESYEFTTKPHKKRRRTTSTTTSTHKPKRYKNKYKVRKPLKVSNLYDYEEFEYDTEPSTTTTESLKIRHQQLLFRQQEQLQRQQDQLQRQQELLQRQVQPTPPPESTTEISSTSTTTTTSPTTTTIETLLVQGNTTGPDNTTGNNTGYGYGPSNGYESISITYSPTGVGPGPSAGGSPVYIAPSSVYTNPSSTYGIPKPSYGVPKPSYSLPSPSYGPPSSSYGPPSNSYGAPSTSSGFSPSVHGYYQVPFSDWYSNDGSRNSIVKKVNDIIGFDNVFQ